MKIWLGIAALALAPSIASAQQPLSVFIAAGDEHAPSMAIARAQAHAARRRIDIARGALLPTLTASADYFRNQQQVNVTRQNPDGSTSTATVLAQDEIDASVLATLPIIDVDAWSTLEAAEDDAEGSALDALATRDETRVAVTTAYFELAGARAVRAQALQRLQVTQEDYSAWTTRREAGRATELEVARADAEVGFAQDAVATAELQIAIAARALVALTGVTPEDRDTDLTPSTASDLTLADALDGAAQAPAVRAARARGDAASHRQDASWETLLPTLSAQGRERYTNMPGFLPDTLWSVGLVVTWQLDFIRPYEVLAADDARAIADAQTAQVTSDMQTEITNAFHQVVAARSHLAASDRARGAATRAQEDAMARADLGRSTQLDVLIARRDAFDAEISYVLAEADLASARAVLDIRAQRDAR